MSTNFYAIGHRHDDAPEYHVGKRTSGEFLQAMPDDRFRELCIQIEKHCETCSCDEGTMRFEDEYGTKLTALQMFEIMISTGRVSTEQIGTEFS